MAEFRLETERLVLRAWREEDVEPMLEMRSDPRVMATLGPLQSRRDVTDSLARQTKFQHELGHCSWIVVRRDNGEVIGTAGLQPLVKGTPIGEATEIGWKLRFESWGHGFAREAAQASLRWGFAHLPITAIWAITVPGNVRSWGLMERLGMERMAGLDFDHPNLAEGDPLRPHIVYRAARPTGR